MCSAAYFNVFLLCVFHSLATDWEKSMWIRLSSISTFSILEYASMQASSVSYSMNAYCNESPVFQSLMISHDFMGPNREKISSRSWSYVTGLSLQTKSTFFGGSTSASGRSSSISRTAALVLDWCSLISSCNYCSVLPFIRSLMSTASSR